MRVKQARLPRQVAKQDQVFAQHTDFFGRGCGVAAQANGVPITAQQLAHRGAGPHFGHVFQMAGGGAAVSRAGVYRHQWDDLVHVWGFQLGVTPAALISSETRG